jgi:hypothetical protein
MHIQTVTGLIRRSPVAASHKYSGSSRSIRSTGLFAEKNYKGEIEVSYWTGGWSTQVQEAPIAITQFIGFAEAQGYNLTPVSGFTYTIRKAD